MEATESGGRILNNYEITGSLAALATNRQGRLATKLQKQIVGVGPDATLEITASESSRVIEALKQAADSPFYGQQNELAARGLLRAFNEAGVDQNKYSRLQKLQTFLGLVFRTRR